jgi:hypothetical protein
VAKQSRRLSVVRSTARHVAPHKRAVLTFRCKGPAVRASFDLASAADVVACVVVTAGGTQRLTRRPWQTWRDVLRDVALTDGESLQIVVENGSAKERPIEVSVSFDRRRRETAPAPGVLAGRRPRSLH